MAAKILSNDITMDALEYDFRKNEDYVRNVVGLAGEAKATVWNRFGPGIMQKIEDGDIHIPSPLDCLLWRCALGEVDYDAVEAERNRLISSNNRVIQPDANDPHNIEQPSSDLPPGQPIQLSN